MNQQIPPTPKKPVRTTITVDADVLEVFQRLASVTGMSQSKAIGEWLADTVEGAATMADLMEKARKEPVAAMRQMHSYALGLGDMTTEILEGLRKATSKQPVKARQLPTPGGDARLRAPARVGAATAPSADTLRAFIDEVQARGDAITPPVGNTGGKLPRKPKNRG